MTGELKSQFGQIKHDLKFVTLIWPLSVFVDRALVFLDRIEIIFF